MEISLVCRVNSSHLSKHWQEICKRNTYKKKSFRYRSLKLGDRKLKYNALKALWTLSFEFLGNMVYYVAKNCYKEHHRKIKTAMLSMICKKDEFTKEITCAIISVPFISWFTCAVVGSFCVITNRIKIAIVGLSCTLVDVWNHIEHQWQ